MLNIWHMIMCQELLILHKIQLTNEPQTLNEIFIQQKENTRTTTKTNTKLYTKYTPKTKMMKNSLIYKITQIYNNLDPDFHNMKGKKFKNDIKYNIQHTYTLNRIPGTSDTDTDSDNSD